MDITYPYLFFRLKLTLKIQVTHFTTSSNNYLAVSENPSHHSPYLRQLMQEEFQSRQQSSPDKAEPAIDSSVTDELTDSRTNNKIEDHNNHTKNNCKSEQETVIASGDVKADIVRTLSDEASAKIDVKAEIVHTLSDQASASNKHSKDTSGCVDNKGDATEASAGGNITKSSEKKQKAVKPPSKEETLGKEP